MPLPPGLSLDKRTGLVAGVPTVAGTYTFTLRVRDSQGALRDVEQTVVISPYAPLIISGTPSQYATRGKPYLAELSVAGGLPPVTWAIASGQLPIGMSINAETGEISGTPNDPSETNRAITVRATDDFNSSAQLSYTLRYRAAPATTHVYPAAERGAAYSSIPSVSGGHLPLTFALTSGSLQAGLSFSVGNGRISGTPTVVGNNPIVVTITDTAGNVVTIEQTIVVAEAYVPVAISGSMSGTTKSYQRAAGNETISPSSTLAVSGGTGAITTSWARISGSSKISAASTSSLSTGFTSSAGPGEDLSAVFRLTATDGVTSATYDVTIRSTNTYVVPSMSGSPPTQALRGKPYSGAFSLSGGLAPYTYAIVAGSLPGGLSINASTGTIAGTPSEDGGYGERGITVRATDALGQSASAAFTLSYRNAISVNVTTVTGEAQQGRAYSSQAFASGGYLPLTFSISAGGLPAGLSLNSGNGVISGTPSGSGLSEFVVRATDTLGNYGESYRSINTFAALGVNNVWGGGSLTVGVAMGVQGAQGVNGKSPYSYAIVGGSLPPGLSLNSGNGQITGTPTTTGGYAYIIRVTDSMGYSVDTGTVNVTVNPAVSLQDGDIYVLSFGQSSIAALELNANGTVYATPTTNNLQPTYAWLAGGSSGAYEVMYTLQSGSTPTGSALGAWLNLGTSRRLTLTRANPGGSISCQVLVQIRAAGGGPVLAASTYTITAERDV